MKRLRRTAALVLGCALWVGTACAVQGGGGRAGGGGSQTCSTCNGTGENPQADPATGAKGKCSTCNGTGTVSGRGK